MSALSTKQAAALHALGRQSMTLAGVAQNLDTTMPAAAKVLDALYRKSFVTITPMGRYAATERGRKKVAA